MSRIRKFDFLIIGSGIAGLTFALKTAKFGKVAIVTKKEDTESNTNYAQGGIASAISDDDSFDLHIDDTFKTGAGICHRDAVEVTVKEGPQYIRALEDLGTRFTKVGRGKNKRYDLGKEGGHSVNRIVHAKDLTGREVERALLSATRKNKNIKIFSNHVAVDLLTEHNLMVKRRKKESKIHCWGAYILDTENKIVEIFFGKIIMLSTGGTGKIYLHTTNPDIATGDGIAIAYRAGGKIANLEFMQFHPTTLYSPGNKPFLISEAVRGAGGILKNYEGKNFVKEYDLRGSLAPRDIVARAIDRELKKSGRPCVYLDMSKIKRETIKKKFPNIYKTCLSYKIDITKERIPVVPSAHYMCGGLVTDLLGRTSIERLYASGEVACTGLHGANRLASNSLLEALVFSNRAARDAEERIKNIPDKFPEILPWDDSGTFNHDEWILISHDKYEIQKLMWDYVGIVRSDFRLQRAERRIKLIAKEVEQFYKKTKVTEQLLELRNLSTVAELLVKCAIKRKESRGLHYTTDYPQKDDKKWKKDTYIFKKV